MCVSPHALTAMQLTVEAKIRRLLEVSEHFNAGGRGLHGEMLQGECTRRECSNLAMAQDLASFVSANPIWGTHVNMPKDIQITIWTLLDVVAAEVENGNL